MKNKNLLLLLLAFIALQPIIDVLTTASIFFVNTSLTIGVLIRVAYMGAMLLLLLWMSKKSKLSRLFTIYLIGLAVMIGINVIVNLQVKDPYYLFQELKFFNKVIYFHIVLLGLTMVYRELKNQGFDIAGKTTRYFWISGLIIGVVFVIAQITGTSLSNYSHTKVGYTGWFYAGNEIGAIMAIVLPIMALYATQKTDSWKKPWAWIPFLLLSLGMLALGTKVGYGGIIIVLLSVLFGSLIMRFLLKVKTANIGANLIVSTILTTALIVVTPLTPVYGNMFAHIDSLGIDFGDAVERPEDSGEQPSEGEEPVDNEPTISEEQLQNLVFSSRDVYSQIMKDDFNSSPIMQQLFGMGFAGNYEPQLPGKTPKMIEMDFHDWFFSFGWIGFIYLIAPFVWFAGRYLIHFLLNIKTHFTYFYVLYGVAFLLGTGIAYTAGHVLTAPAVSIYLSAILAMLVVKENLIHSK